MAGQLIQFDRICDLFIVCKLNRLSNKPETDPVIKRIPGTNRKKISCEEINWLYLGFDFLFGMHKYAIRNKKEKSE